MRCPNVTSKEWSDLVKQVGSEARAMAAYVLNDYDIPDPATGELLIGKQKTQEKDTQDSRRSNEFKLKRAKEQKLSLQKAKNRATYTAQKETIDKLLSMNNDYQEFLESNIEKLDNMIEAERTISATEFIGSSTFKGDSSLYEDFKLFGTAMHDLLEEAQQAALNSGKTMSEVVDEDFFDDFLKRYIKRNPFYIKSLSPEEMFLMAQSIIANVDHYNGLGAVILPEITITGNSASGAKVVGRLDLLVVHPSGDTTILDFKTKKVKNMMQTQYGKTVANVGSALVNLSLTMNEIENNEATGQSFKLLAPKRTTYDTWLLQLDLYDNMLKQGDIDVKKKSIVSLLYEVDPDSKEYVGRAIKVFDEQDWYTQALNIVKPENAKGFWFVNTDLGKHVAAFKKAVAIEMPISDEAEEEIKLNPESAFEFIPGQKGIDNFIEDLTNIVTGQVENISRELLELGQKPSRNEAREELLKERRSNLRNFQKVIDSLSVENPKALMNASNFFYALELVEDDINMLLDKTMEAFESYNDKLKNSEGMGVIKDSVKELEQIREAFEKSKTFTTIIQTMQSIVNEAPGLDPDSPVKRRLGEIGLNVQKIASKFREIGLQNAMEIVMSPGEQVFEKVTKDVRDILLPKLLTKEKELEELKKKGSSGFFKSLRGSFYSMLDKGYRDRLESTLSPEGKTTLTAIESLEREIIMLRHKMTGIQYDEAKIKDYITGITNPASIIYLGAQNLWNADSLLKGFALDSYIASASNSDLGISALTMMLKNQEATARRNIINDVKMMKFDRIRKSLIESGRSLEEINSSISEWREISYYDKTSNSIQTKKVLFLAKPFSSDYEKTYREYSIKKKILNKELWAAKAEYNEKFGNAPQNEVDEAKKNYEKKVAERNEFTTDYTEWLMNNASTPYTKEWYELQLALPNDLRNELQKIYLEKEVILKNVGRGDEILLEEEDFTRLQELDVEAKKLRQKAKEENEAYADYIDRFNRLYEYETNQKYYDAMEASAKVKYGDDPAMMKKWYDENEVERPTSEWYERLNHLYERRSFYLTSDSILTELFEERRELIRPFKTEGRINPSVMSEEEIDQITHIEGLIEDRIEDLKQQPSDLSKEEKAAVSAITQEIDSIRTKNSLNPRYVETFDDKYKVLSAAYADVNNAQRDYVVAKQGTDKSKIEEAQSNLKQKTNRFAQVESEFEKWYEKNHYNKYVSITKGAPRAFKSPKSINFESLPAPTVRDQYMERVPNPKYYKVKRPRIGNWVLDDKQLTNEDIKELQKDPENVEKLKASGRLTTAPGAYNEDFVKSPDGIPMPKEILVDEDGKYYIDPNASSTKNVNPNYFKVLNDPQLKELYDSLTDMFFGLQKKTEGRMIGYQVPGFASSLVENIARDGFVKGFKKQKDIFLDKHIKTVESEQDRVENLFGDLGKRLRMRYTNQLDEGLQSEDVLGSIMAYSTEAHFNIAMQEIAPQVRTFVDFLKFQRTEIEEMIGRGETYTTNEKGERVQVNMEARKKEIDELIKITEYEADKFLTGQFEKETNRKVKKMMNQFFGWTAFIRIGFDIANQTKNYVSGNVQAFIAAGAQDNDHYSKEDWAFAKKKVYGYQGFLFNYFSDWGKISDLNESTMLYRMYNPLQKDILKYYKDVSGTKGRKVGERLANPGELGFLLQDKGDTEIGVTVMFAVMNNYKYPLIDKIDSETKEKTYKRDDNGDVIYVPVHEAYVKDKDGALVRRNDVDFSQQDEDRVRNIIYSEIRRAQGNYAKSDQTEVESRLLGKMLFFFRKFLVPGMLNRFGYLRPNWEGSEVSVGYWRAVAMAWKYFGPKALAKEFFVGTKMLEKMNTTGLGTFVIKGADGEIKKEDVGDIYIRKVQQARRDAIAMMLVSILGFMLLAYVKQKSEDDEELGVLEGNAIRVIWGTQMETMSMFPIGQGSSEYVKNFTTAVPFVRELTALIKMGNHAWNLGLAMIINGGEEPDPGYDSEFYEEAWKDAFYSRASGPYEKGDIKLVKDFTDLTGIKNFRDIFNPGYRIENLRKLQ